MTPCNPCDRCLPSGTAFLHHITLHCDTRQGHCAAAWLHNLFIIFSPPHELHKSAYTRQETGLTTHNCVRCWKGERLIERRCVPPPIVISKCNSHFLLYILYIILISHFTFMIWAWNSEPYWSTDAWLHDFPFHWLAHFYVSVSSNLSLSCSIHLLFAFVKYYKNS